MTLISSTGRYLQTMKVALGLEVQAPLQVDEEVKAVYVVNDPADQSAQLIRGERAGWGVVDFTASAGNHPQQRFQNSVNSGLLVLLDRVVVFSPTAQEVVMNFSTAMNAGTEVTTKDFRDMRNTPASDPVTRFSSANLAAAVFAAGTFQMRDILRAATREVIDVGLTMPPGFALVVTGATAVTRLVCCYYFRERIATQDDLTARSQ